MDRPNFAKDYPDDRDLLALVEAFESGNFRAVREGTTRLLADANLGEAVRTAARDLRSRTEPDPLQVWLLLLAIAVVVTLSGYEIVRHARPPAVSAPKPAAEHAR